MDIILYSDFLLQYFELYSRPLKNEKDNLRYNIVQNVKNRIVLSDNYVSYLETLFTSQHKFYNQFTELFLEFMDHPGTRSLTLISCPTSTNLQSEFSFLISNNTSKVFVSISENIIPGLNQTAAMDAIQKPNWHWQVCHLAANHQISVSHHDFLNDTEIQNFFSSLLKLSNSICELYYFDRYSTNINRHNCFDPIIAAAIPMKIYTYAFNPIRRRIFNATELRALKSTIITSFGATSTVHYTTNGKLLHERTLLFNNLILDSSDDFAKIKTAILTWKLTLTYSAHDFSEWLNKTPRFTLL